MESSPSASQREWWIQRLEANNEQSQYCRSDNPGGDLQSIFGSKAEAQIQAAGGKTMSAALRFDERYHTPEQSGERCEFCGAKLDEDEHTVDAGLVLRGAFELFRGDPCAMFLVSEKMLEPSATNEELAQRFSLAFGRPIRRQSVHRRLTKAAKIIPQLRAILCPRTRRG